MRSISIINLGRLRKARKEHDKTDEEKKVVFEEKSKKHGDSVVNVSKHSEKMSDKLSHKNTEQIKQDEPIRVSGKPLEDPNLSKISGKVGDDHNISKLSERFKEDANLSHISDKNLHDFEESKDENNHNE